MAYDASVYGEGGGKALGFHASGFSEKRQPFGHRGDVAVELRDVVYVKLQALQVP